MQPFSSPRILHKVITPSSDVPLLLVCKAKNSDYISPVFTAIFDRCDSETVSSKNRMPSEHKFVLF